MTPAWRITAGRSRSPVVCLVRILEDRFTGKGNLAVLIPDYLYRYLITDLNFILDGGHAVVGQFTDVDHAFLAGQNFHKRPEVKQAGNLAGIYIANLYILGQAFYDFYGFTGAGFISGANNYGTVILDINGGFSFLGD